MSTLALPIYLTGDINLPLIKPADPVGRSKDFNDLISSYGLVQCVTGLTHDQGGLLDVLITNNDSTQQIAVIDVGLTDHRLLTWNVNLNLPAPL